MKKLLYTFLAVSLIFSACEEDTPLPAANNNNSTLAIGDTHQGGIIFYLDGNGGGLIAAPTDQGMAEWGCNGITISGADGITIGTGAQNTSDIEADCTTSGTAADICANLSLGGYSDWYLPSKDELNEMYLNIANGSLLGNVGGLNFSYYWSSTEIDSNDVWVQFFQTLYQSNHTKNSTYYVRAVRAF